MRMQWSHDSRSSSVRNQCLADPSVRPVPSHRATHSAGRVATAKFGSEKSKSRNQQRSSRKVVVRAVSN